MGMIKRYGFWGFIKTITYVVRTKLLFSKARLIRFPIDIRNKAQISVSSGFTSGRYCRIEAFSETNQKVLIIGENVQINDFVHITAIEKVEIGKNVLIASKVYISDCSHGSYSGDKFDSDPTSIPKDRPLLSKRVCIKDNVWLGEFVSVLPGVTIGKGSIIGANSVVSKSIPEHVIAVGSPAKPIKKYNFKTLRWDKIK